MKRSVFNVALAILISLGVVACKSTDNPVKETPKELKKPSDKKTEDGKTEDGKTEDGKAEDGKAEDGKAEDGKAEDKKPEGDKVPDAFQEKSAVQKIQYLKENNIQTRAQGGSQPAGTVVAGHAKTYASYAAVRAADDSNEYVIDSTMYTPINQKDYVATLDAIYTGKATFTASTVEKKENDADTMDLSFFVKNNSIYGAGNGYYMENDGTRRVNYQGFFALAPIKVEGDKLSFTGEFSTDNVAINDGHYSGYFAGDKAQEVVGKINATFVEEGKTNTLKGAFVAEKQ
ncbi:hypothetical protein JFL47_03000 [Haemophilus haemoglobinophilus]|nr:hypothetical protein [Canicola haemoglobinophilus]